MRALDYISNARPELKGAAFALYPLSYYITGILNYSQTGKNVILGFFTFTTLFYWRKILAARFNIDPAIILILAIIAANIAFQATVRDVFGVQQDDIVVIQSIFSTNLGESTEFFVQYWRYIAVHFGILLLFCLSYWACFIRQYNRDFKSSSDISKFTWLAVASFTLILVAIHFNPALRRGNPLYYFPYYYTKWQAELANAEALQKILANTANDPALATMHLSNNTDKNTLVLVIGESDTRHNWSLYGYKRKTNPELEKLKDDLLVFNNIKSADASTIGSITKIFTPATQKAPGLWKTEPGIVTIAKHLGYKVIWITNQGTRNTGIVSILASQADEVIFTNAGGSRSEGSHDEVVMKPYDQALADTAEKKFIVVHILGAHPAYNFRYPESHAIFEGLNDDVSNELARNGRSIWAIEFRNYYDSAIHYEDYVLSSLLKRLMEKKGTNTSFLYLADHGEDVAHHTDFSGHNHRVKEMWEIPFIFWSSNLNHQSKTLRNNIANRSYNADVVDHTILGLLNIEGDYYQPELDIFSNRFESTITLSKKNDRKP